MDGLWGNYNAYFSTQIVALNKIARQHFLTLHDEKETPTIPHKPIKYTDLSIFLCKRYIMRLKANTALFFVALIWGSSFITQGIAAQYHIAYIFNGASFLLGGLILRPFISHKSKISRGQWKWMLIAGLILFLATAFQQVGIFYTKIANASFLTSLFIVITPFLLWIGFRERPHWVDVLSITMAIIGAYFLSTAGIGIKIQLGDGLEILGAIFWGMHIVILGKFASKYDTLSFASGHFIITGILNLLVGFFLEDAKLLLVLPVALATLYRGLLSVGVGYTLQVWSQNHTSPTDAALILGLESVFAATFAWLILEQTLLPLQILGSVIIFIAILLSQFKTLRTEKNV